VAHVRQLLIDATERLTVAGVPSPRVDAELLLAALLDSPRSRLLTLDTVPGSVARTFDEQVTRRVSREPLQHITGRAPFRHIELDVGPGVFIPRPETELLVDAVLPHLRTIETPAVVDLCAGSGALALAIADEVPGARVVAVERSFTASRFLTKNAAGTSVRVVTGDVRDPELLSALYGRADVVVSNPPYVPLPTEVDPEVLADPHEAVFAGGDGLELLPTIVTRAAMLLKPGGLFAVEHDDTHGSAVPALLVDDGRWTAIRAGRDLADRPRYSVATRI
jgi:release factor glutamine methyltransferase